MFEEIRSGVYQKINELLYSDDKINKLLMDGIVELLGEVEYDVNVYFFESSFSEEVIDSVEESEPNSGIDKNLMGLTTIYEDGSITICFSCEAIRVMFSDFNPFSLRNQIKSIGTHEAYHVLQYRYVYERGGSKAIEHLMADIKKVDYFDNILEEGAYKFQFFGIKQDFESVFAPYV